MVSFVTEDGITVWGTLFGEGEMAVILAHMGGTTYNQVSWYPFARLAAGHRFTVLTFDFRGHGRTEGSPDQWRLIFDLRAAIEFLQSRGSERIVCMGASQGGTACLRAAVETDLAGLVVIASPMTLGPPTRVVPDELARLTVPKLFICARDDPFGVADEIRQMYDLSPEPKRIKLFSGTVHGTSLFNTRHGDELRGLLLGFLEEIRTPAEAPRPTVAPTP
jgi:pimeloyl-ACP methyl ester carboxylesterase